MNITTSHSNSGFRSKFVEVTYTRPRTTVESLGLVPATNEDRPDNIAWGKELFIASTKENPVGYTGYKSKELRVESPVLDAAGKPVMETVTEKVEIPGPKLSAVKFARDTLVSTAMFSAALTLPLVGLGAFAGAVTGHPELLNYGLYAGLGMSALCLGLPTAAMLSVAKDEFSRTNTLEMKPTPIVSRELQGYDVSNKESLYEFPYLHFEPRLKETTLGQWEKPTITSSR